MIVGVFQFELYIPGSSSRKDKRSVLNSLKQKLKNAHNVAVSEVEFQDKTARSVLGISTVCLQEGDVTKIYDAIYKQIMEDYAVQIVRAAKDYC
jgi:uncharacterized protein YlxP (DUF503 family)